MKLLLLELNNFRQFKDKVIHFNSGLTSIIGQNGSGKSTILEGICFSLFGTAALRGTLQEVANVENPNLKVSLEFELNNEVYKVQREKSKAIFTGNNISAEGTSAVNTAIKKLLGLDYSQFCNSFIANQKSLKFLDITPDKRRSTVMNILGLDKYINAQTVATKRISEQTGLIKGIQEVSADSLAEAKKELKDNQDKRKSLQKEFEELKIKYDNYKKKEEYNALLDSYEKSLKVEELKSSTNYKDAATRNAQRSQFITLYANHKQEYGRIVNDIKASELKIKEKTEALGKTVNPYEEIENRAKAEIKRLEIEFQDVQNFILCCPEEYCFFCKQPLNKEKYLEELVQYKKDRKRHRRFARRRIKQYTIIKDNHDNKWRYQQELNNLSKEIDDIKRRVSFSETQKQIIFSELSKIDSYLSNAPEVSQQDLEAETFIKMYESLGDPSKYKMELASLNYAVSDEEDVEDKYYNVQLSLKEVDSSITFLTKEVERLKDNYNRWKKEKGNLVLMESSKKVLKDFSDLQISSIGPDLENKASRLINILLEGKYDKVELNDSLQPIVYKDSVRIPTLSGGEEDILALCLRISLSQMICERTGNNISILLLDEIFSALDVNKRNLAIEALINLKQVFNQIIFISHIPELSEYSDHLIELN